MNKFVNLVKRGWCRCKSMAIAFAVALGFCAVSHAEGTEQGYDIGVVTEVSTKLKTTLTTFWTDNKEAILAVIGIIVVLSLIWLVVKLFKRSTSKA